ILKLSSSLVKRNIYGRRRRRRRREDGNGDKFMGLLEEARGVCEGKRLGTISYPLKLASCHDWRSGGALRMLSMERRSGKGFATLGRIRERTS
ncbi:hypothetical protein GIB67_037646, partial [Kingdonia uniflora]